MNKKLKMLDDDYWPQVCIALSQVTFGVAWASLFLPLDVYKFFVIGLNLVATIILIKVGRFLGRKK